MEHLNDIVRLGVVYIHILAVSVAIGTIFLADVRFVIGKLDGFSILCTQNVILYTLIVLYITGAMIIYIDYGTLFVDLTTAPKLAAKLFVVGLLTLNGFILHHYILPMFSDLSRLSKTEYVLIGMSASFSAVSWCYAIFLGKAKPLVAFLGLNDFIELYLVIVSFSVIIGAIIMLRHSPSYNENNISFVKQGFDFIKKLIIYFIDSLEYLYNFCVRYMRRDVILQVCIILPIMSFCVYIIINMLGTNGSIGSNIATAKNLPVNTRIPVSQEIVSQEVHNETKILSDNIKHSNFTTMKISFEPQSKEDIKDIIFVSLDKDNKIDKGKKLDKGKKYALEQKQKKNYILQISASQSKKSAQQYLQKLLQNYKDSFSKYTVRIVPYKKGLNYWYRIRIYDLSYQQGKAFCKFLNLKECFLSHSG